MGQYIVYAKERLLKVAHGGVEDRRMMEAILQSRSTTSSSTIRFCSSFLRVVPSPLLVSRFSYGSRPLMQHNCHGGRLFFRWCLGSHQSFSSTLFVKVSIINVIPMSLSTRTVRDRLTLMSRRTQHRRRSSSSSSSTTIKQHHDQRRLVQKVLTTPVGHLNPVQWDEAALALTNDPIRLFDLFDRLIQEIQTLKVNNIKHQFVFAPMKANRFNVTLQYWNDLLTTATTLNLPTPQELWNKLKQYVYYGVVCLDGTSYSTVIHGIGQRIGNRGTGPVLAGIILQEAIDLALYYPTICSHPNSETISSVLNIWSISGRPDALQVTQHHWNNLRRWSTFRKDCYPTPRTYAAMIDMWSNSKHLQAPYKIEELLCEMEQSPPSRHHETIMMTSCDVAYTACLRAIVKLNQGSRGPELIDRMIMYKVAHVVDASISRHKDMEGFNIAVASVFDSYRRSNNVELMAVLLDKLELLSKLTKNRDYLPDASFTDTLLNMYCSLGDAPKADDLLHRMIGSAKKLNKESKRPSRNAVISVLRIWAKSNMAQAAERMMIILTAMHEFGPIHSECYKVVLRFYSNQGDVESAQSAQKLLLRDMAMTTSDAISYDLVLKAWCKAGYPERAQSLLDELCSQSIANKVHVVPDTRHFSTVLDGWRKSNQGDHALLQIAYLFSKMEHLHKSHGLDTIPDSICYSLYLDCLAKSSKIDAPDQAERLLRSLCSRPRDNDDWPVPDAIAFDIVLSAWVRSKRPDSTSRILSLLKYMENYNVKPTVRTYNMLVTALVHKGRHGDAQRLLSDLDSVVPVDSSLDQRLHNPR